MQVFSGIGQLKTPLKDSVAAIGVFDGVHLGHRAVIQHAVSEAKKTGGLSVVVTFDPHPVKVLHPHRFSFYVTSLGQRLDLLASLGVDVCLVVKFSKRFATMAPVDFVKRYLVDGLRAKRVVVGSDFHFGYDRGGSISLLKKLGGRYGFTVEAEEILTLKNINIKSSLIRKLVSAGDIAGAERFLGHPFTLSGIVVHGDNRGHRLGFPTANLRKENVIIPPSGIYIARVNLPGETRNALLYIGQRPSFKSGRARVVLEAYIMDYSGDLYGQRIMVELIKKIRGDRRFSDEKDLVAQIRDDERRARAYFAARSC
jgi:riboflavin kinase/FMN adenylyltransferase